MSGERLYSVFKSIAQRAVPDENMADLLYGVVKSVTPLKIEIENKFTLFEDQVYLSPLCIEFMGVGHGSRVWRGLEINDTVILLRHGKGQMFYALQRVGEL